MGGNLNGWVFPAHQRKEVLSALQQAGITVSGEEGNNASSSTSAPSSDLAVAPSVNAQASLNVKMHKRAILVTGDTLSVKTQLKALGGNWNRGLIGWIFPGSKRAEVVALLRQDHTNKVVDECSPAATGGGSAPGDGMDGIAKGIDDDDADAPKAKTEAPPQPIGSKPQALPPNAVVSSDDDDDRPLSMRVAAPKRPAAPGSELAAKAPKAKVAKTAMPRAKAAKPNGSSGPKRKSRDYEPDEDDDDEEDEDEDEDEDEGEDDDDEAVESDDWDSKNLAW